MKNVTVGRGKAIHATVNGDGQHVVCNTGGAINRVGDYLTQTSSPVTCKRCLKKTETVETETSETETTGEKVQPGDRILVKTLHNASGLRTRILPATGPDQDGTQVSQVVEKSEARDGEHFWILTGQGGFHVRPTDVIKLAPEDDAAVADILADNHDRVVQDEVSSLRAEFPDAPPARRMAIRRRLTQLSCPLYPDRAEPDEDFQVDWLRARFPLAGTEEQETIKAALARLGTVLHPEGTKEYAKFRDELRRTLSDPASFHFLKG